MFEQFLRVAAFGLVIAACRGAALVRQEIDVPVAAAHERWRLEWRRPPKEVCAPETDYATACPCTGFAYGEMGSLRLVRARPDTPEEQLVLDSLFGYGDNPADSGLAALQRWPVLDSDWEAKDRHELGVEVRKRVPASIMSLGDYDHDGRATEFLLQVGTEPCGKREAMVIGVSSAQPHLHAFTSVAHPRTPLVLEVHIWQALLRASGPISAIEWACGDHASDTETNVRLTATPAGFAGQRRTYDCKTDGTAGKLVSSEPL